jgi:DNA-binding phage protein
MTRKHIPVGELVDEWMVDEWMKDPAFVAAYDALEEEFALADAFIRAQARAELTQEEVARRMGTTQAVVARLASGCANPSTRRLERFATATGTWLRVAFEPVAAAGG